MTSKNIIGLTACVLLFVSGFASATTPSASDDVPPKLGVDFLKRIQSKTLRHLIDVPDHAFAVSAGRHELKVPCDGVANGKFATIPVNLESKYQYQIQFMSCGVLIGKTLRQNGQQSDSSCLVSFSSKPMTTPLDDYVKNGLESL